MIKRTEELTLVLTKEDYLILQRLAEHLGTTMSGALAYAIQSALDRIKAESK